MATNSSPRVGSSLGAHADSANILPLLSPLTSVFSSFNLTTSNVCGAASAAMHFFYSQKNNPSLSLLLFPSIIYLQETKIVSAGQGKTLVAQQWPGGCGFLPPALVTKANGYVGGVGILFHRKLGLRLAVREELRNGIFETASNQLVGYKIEAPAELEHRVVAVRLRIQSQFVLMVSVYAPPNNAKDGMQRPNFFTAVGSWLAEIRCNKDEELILGGDFNVTPPDASIDRTSNSANPSQALRQGSVGYTELKNHILIPWGLLDVARTLDPLSPSHTCFTATRTGISSSRIDAVFTSPTLDLSARNCTARPGGWREGKVTNEHYCLSVCFGEQSTRKRGGKPFRFDNSLLRDVIAMKELSELIEDHSNKSVRNSPGVDANAEHLRDHYDQTKAELSIRVAFFQRNWKWQQSRKLKKLLETLKAADDDLALEPRAETASARARARLELQLYVSRNSQLFEAGMHADWNRVAGGNGSKEFYEVVNRGSSAATITQLRDPVTKKISSDASKMKASMRTAWGPVFASPDTGAQPKHRNPHPPSMRRVLRAVKRKLSNADRKNLDDSTRKLLSPEGEASLKASLFKLSLDTSPGSDGLTTEFYRAFWEPGKGSLGTLLTGILPVCVASGRLTDSMLRAWVRMLWKSKGDRDDPLNYRPIMRLNTDYKIFTLTLARLIEEVAGTLLHPSQTGFRSDGATIDDNLLCMRAVWFDGQQGTTKTILQSTDFRKAYDSVYHEFITAALLKMGFPPVLVDVIRAIYPPEGIVMHFLVGGGFPSEGLKRGKGTHQGCPLSPILFCLCASILLDFVDLESPHAAGLILTSKGRLSEDIQPDILSSSMYVDDAAWLNALAKHAQYISSVLIPIFSKACGLFTNRGKGVGVAFEKGAFAPKDLDLTDYLSIGEWRSENTALVILGLAYGRVIKARRSFDLMFSRVNGRLAHLSSFGLTLQERARTLTALINSCYVYAGRHQEPSNAELASLEKTNRLFLWRNQTFAGVKVDTEDFDLKNKRACWAPVSHTRTCAPWDQGGLAQLDLGAHFRSLKLSNVQRLCDARHPAWKQQLRAQISAATDNCVRDEFLFSPSCTFKLSRGLDPYWTIIAKHWFKVIAPAMERPVTSPGRPRQFEELMGQPLLFNNKVLARLSDSADHTPLEKSPLARLFLRSKDVWTVSDLLRWTDGMNGQRGRYIFLSFEGLMSRNDQSTTGVRGNTIRQYNSLIEWFSNETSPWHEVVSYGGPQPITPSHRVGAMEYVTIDSGPRLKSVAKVTARIGRSNRRTFLRLQPLSLHPLGLIQNDDLEEFDFEIIPGKREPYRVLVGLPFRKIPLNERHNAQHAAGISHTLPFHADKWGLYCMRASGGELKRNPNDPTPAFSQFVELFRIRSKDIYAMVKPAPTKRTFTTLQNWWMVEAGRPIDLESVFTLSSPTSKSLSARGREICWRIAARAVVCGTVVSKWGVAQSTACPRRDCDCKIESLIHAFHGCGVATDLWRWMYRVLDKGFGIRIAPPSRGRRPRNDNRLLRVALRFDGSSRHARGKGRGPGGGGAVLRDLASGHILWVGCQHDPHCTVNEAEWAGLELGLRAAERLGADTLDVRGDSNLVINQVSGKWQIRKDVFRPHFATCRAIMAKCTIEKLEHIVRGHNTAADAMANLAADGQTMEVWTKGKPADPPPIVIAPNDPANLVTPDVATCLLGILPISNSARINEPVDWFQVMRLSVLDHLDRSRSSARVYETHTSARSIRAAVFRDIIREVQLRWRNGVLGDSQIADMLLRPGVNRAAIRRESFVDLTTW